MEFTTNDGIQLNYQSYGNGQPVVFIHGFGGYQEIWTMQIKDFVDHGFNVITYDQRNHGASQFDSNLTKIDRLIYDLKNLIDGLHLQDVVLVGHSMGASVIYGFFDKNLDENVCAAVAVDQSPKMIGNAAWPYGFMNATRANYQEKLQELPHIRETLNGVKQKCRERVKIAQQQFPFDWSACNLLLLDHARQDWRKAVTSMKNPLLLMTANQSPFFDGAFADVMCTENQSYLSHIAVNQTGHCIMAEQPDKFNQTVQDFINQKSKI